MYFDYIATILLKDTKKRFLRLQILLMFHTGSQIIFIKRIFHKNSENNQCFYLSLYNQCLLIEAKDKLITQNNTVLASCMFLSFFEIVLEQFSQNIIVEFQNLTIFEPLFHPYQNSELIGRRCVGKLKASLFKRYLNYFDRCFDSAEVRLQGLSFFVSVLLLLSPPLIVIIAKYQARLEATPFQGYLSTI